MRAYHVPGWLGRCNEMSSWRRRVSVVPVLLSGTVVVVVDVSM